MSRKSMIVFKLKKSLNDIFSFNHSPSERHLQKCGCLFDAVGEREGFLLWEIAKLCIVRGVIANLANGTDGQ